MMKIAIITARGGSKRIPHKNIKDFCGQPIICYSIKAAIESNLFNEVMVSTDDEAIASIARQAGASIPFMRSAQTSDDYATTADVIREVLENYQTDGKHYKYACCIYPTAPFVTAQKLIDCYNQMVNNNCDSALPVVRYSFPPQRAFIIRNDRIQYQFPEYARTRSQDLEAIYHDSGQFYFFDTDKFLQGNPLIGDNTYPFVVPEEEVQDIDNLSDWKMAEMKYMLIKNKM